MLMPKKSKNYPKVKPKKTRHKKIPPKPVSITTRKSYWISLTLSITVFASVFGYFMNLPLENIAVMLVTVLLLIGFAFDLRFKPSTAAVSKRATFIFVGASVIGFCIWAAIVLSLNATGFHTQVAGAIGDAFFAITSLIICLISGAFIGDWIGENRERIRIFLKNKLANRIFF
jgi:FtsH-binding integral membrane protein